MLHHLTKCLLTGSLAIASFGVSTLTLPSTSLAQQRIRSEAAFGQGVHDYFDGLYEKTDSGLSAAAKAGSKDPRIFFFRGLARMKMAQKKKAFADFRRGASLEVAQHGKRNYSVGRSLMRVQGPVRIAIENARSQARKTKIAHVKALAARRYALPPGVSKAISGPDGSVANANLPDVSKIIDSSAPFGDDDLSDASEGAASDFSDLPQPRSQATSAAPNTSGSGASGSSASGSKKKPSPPVVDPFAASAKKKASSPPKTIDPFAAPVEKKGASKRAIDPFADPVETKSKKKSDKKKVVDPFADPDN